MSANTNKKLAYLSETKDLIKAALIEKGQPVSDSDTFRSYAGKILDIVVGDGDGGAGGGAGGAGGWVSASGVLEGKSGTVTVQHNMGVKPDIVVLWSRNFVESNLGILVMSGVSSIVKEKGATLSNLSKTSVYSSAGGSAITFGVNAAIDSGDSSLNTYGFPRNLTNTTFDVGGGSTGKLVSGIQYDWFAIGGIT